MLPSAILGAFVASSLFAFTLACQTVLIKDSGDSRIDGRFSLASHRGVPYYSIDDRPVYVNDHGLFLYHIQVRNHVE